MSTRVPGCRWWVENDGVPLCETVEASFSLQAAEHDVYDLEPCPDPQVRRKRPS